MAYILYKIDDDDEIEDVSFDYEKDTPKKFPRYLIKYYHSSLNNGALFTHPMEIHDRKTLNEFINEAVIDIANQKGVKRENSEWKFYQYLHYEVVIYI